ncbi:MAG: cobyric acid synthase [Acidobacteria bacterium]|nr:cobyric acid synthase [Acidobacteriota bacterium]
MVQATGSHAGKSTVVTGLCRLARRRGLAVAPFKPQNMSNNAAACPDGGEIGRAQALQARAAGLAPTVDMNPVLLKPESDGAAQVVVQGTVAATWPAGAFLDRRGGLLAPVLDSFERLSAASELVVVEGAGSAAETNLRRNDIANMGFARRVDAPVCLLADIDRGGAIAALVGTCVVLDPADAALVTSFAINRFRGDRTRFADGVREIERRTSWPCRGVVPWLDAARRLPAEDSVGLQEADAERAGPAEPGRSRRGCVKVVVPLLPRIANADDFDPLRMEPAVDLVMTSLARPLPRDADVVVLPGTKSTLEDLASLRSHGWDHDILAHARAGGRVLGVCGGYQMLGRRVRDAAGADGPAGEARGLELLDVETRMESQKAVRPVGGTCARTSAPIRGYEIHTGRTVGPDAVRRPFAHLERGPDGAVSADGRVEGTYVHGLFHEDAFRARWLERVRAGSSSSLAREAALDGAIDELADRLEAALDVDALLADAGL